MFVNISISELVLGDINGLLFGDSAELVQCLVQLFKDYPTGKKLEQFRANLETNFCVLDWDINWSATAFPVFQK